MYPHERSLVKRLAGKPFALIGVNTDSDLEEIRRIKKEKDLSWRSFWDGSQGPICEDWRIQGFPTIVVIDHEFKIRAKDVRGKQLDKVIDELVEEAEAAASDSSN